MIDKIFEPYFSTKENLIGTGLGLYMSKMLIEKNMKGSLTVQNTEKGAAFTIEITTN
ncbi:MAG: HAMP domain-containing histidine kinase [Candidatus Cloacimonetes bacterium]|nr:HAMP domain-containing histidine kinase [Candidatus Cloacimonadota bacterium]